MLLSLYVKNYAIIHSLRVDFCDGLNILSGETGAGKSVIVGSLSLLLGSRGSADMIRAGQEKLVVEGVFSFDEMPGSLRSILEENDIEWEDDLIIRREITSRGKNTCRINDVSVSVGYLKNIGNYLVDIHGQHEHQRLLSRENHIAYLDLFGGEEIKDLVGETEEKFAFMKKCASEVSALRKKQKETGEKKDEYVLMVKEIEDVSPMPGEDESIRQRLKVLESAEKIYSLVDSAYDKLYSANSGAVSSLGDAVNAIEKAGEYDEQAAAVLPMLSEALINIEESVNELRAYRSGLEFEPYEIEQLNGRLAEINRLVRKFGDIEEILSRKEYMKQALDELGSIDIDMKNALRALEDAKKEYYSCAEKLTSARKRYSEIFSEKIVSELGDMAMKDAQFEVRFERSGESASGMDDVEFFITANKGQPLRELSKTASGGEISRIMLALKNIIGSRDEVECMIFDEIDTGISGNTAVVVGKKMADISRTKQIIAITHLAQIASMADGHYLIEKKDDGDMTASTLRLIEGEERIKELARIIGSSESDTALVHAKSLYEQAVRYKEEQ